MTVYFDSAITDVRSSLHNPFMLIFTLVVLGLFAAEVSFFVLAAWAMSDAPEHESRTRRILRSCTRRIVRGMQKRSIPRDSHHDWWRP